MKRQIQDWEIQSSDKLDCAGDRISSPDYDVSGWYPSSVPSTVLGTLVLQKVYEDPYFGLNLKDIPPEIFAVSWWYRTAFYLSEEEAVQTSLLEFDGINYRANIWINGQQIAENDTIRGAFRRYRFDVSSLVNPGKNTLAVEVFRPEPGDFSTGFVDWNPPPPDGNMGLFRPVTLRICDRISIERPFVLSHLDPDHLDEAVLSIGVTIVNHSDEPVSGLLEGHIGDIVCSSQVSLAPFEEKDVTFMPDDYPDLFIQDPRIWWPNNLGEPHLYQLSLQLSTGESVCDTSEITFGIKDVEDYVNEQGHRGFKINGRKVLIKSAGWTDDLLLNDTPESLEAQIQYVKHMNLNCIRLEGFWGKDQTLYDLCDRYGILIMAGWSCHWEHEDYLGKPVDPRYGGVFMPEDIDLISRSWEDQLLWLRHHPSIFVWTVASDKVPHPDLEQKYIDTFKKHDPTRPYLNSTGGIGSEQGIITDDLIVSDISGPSRVKMLGPYDYTPPVYWFSDKRLGGAYGFNTETGPGAQVPLVESLRKMIPEEHLWPIDEYWDFHCGLNEFTSLDRFVEALHNRYGESASIEAFDKKAQVMNYELMRPMFEAFQAHKKVATGLVHWMLNAAWPKMYWQLYDSFLMPNAAFYATRKANEPIHLLYHYGEKSVYLVNDTYESLDALEARIRLYDVESNALSDIKLRVNSGPNDSVRIFEIPDFESITPVYFLDVRLLDTTGVEVSRNFYWLSTKPDVLDYEAKVETWSFYTPSKEYADYTSLNALQDARIDVRYNITNMQDGIGVDVVLENKSDTIAFFVECKIVNRTTKETVLPVFWDDNYVNLLPGETRSVSAFIPVTDFEQSLEVKGWNIPPKHLP